VFNDVSCAACHSVPAIGGASGTVEMRFGTPTGDPLSALGGPLIQVNGIGVVGDCDYAGETVPAQAIASGRRTTPLFGLGLVDALTAGALQALAADQRARSPEEAGRVAMVRDVVTGGTKVGKFGWKSQVPTLHQFAGDAYLNEMGITSPDFPNENCPSGDCALLRCNPFPEVNDDGSGVTLFADFMTFLAPPARGAIDAAVTAGEAVFEEIGCARCHTPTLVTGGSSPAAALRFVAFHPFSDFLLHDMGSLGDGIQTGDAGGSEFRTAPLWGLRTTTTYLHDGRAGTLRDAIEAHDGQGSRARDAFRALSAADQDALMAFLGSL
jgi:CxxC motif-containing protein (DUF1111 family)